MLYIIYMVYIIYEMSPMALLFFDCFSCFYSPYDYCALRFTIQKITFTSLRCDVMEMFKKNWPIRSLNRTSDLRSKLLTLGKIKILLLFRSLNRNFAS